MTAIAAIIIMFAWLAVTLMVGWWIVSPAVEWICNKINSLAIRGADYHAMVKEYQSSGEVQDRST